MKSADQVIRALRLVPEVYSDLSRDFLLFTKLADAVYNSSFYNAESIKYATDPKNINSKLLSLLADKFGIDKVDAETLTDTEVRFILRCLPYLIRYKGSLTAIYALINMYFKIYHISGTYEVDVTNKSTIVQNITIADHTILLGLETLALSTNMLRIMAKYLLPPGYSFFIYFYTNLNLTDTPVLDDEVTLLYRSTNLNSQVNQEIPDFINYNLSFRHSIITFQGDGVTTSFSLPQAAVDIKKVIVGGFIINDYQYSSKDHVIIFLSAPQLRTLISIEITLYDKSKLTLGAVDAIRLSGIDTLDNNEFFAGFCSHNDLDIIKTNFEENALAYDYKREAPNAKNHYKNFDVAIFPDHKKRLYITRNIKEEEYQQLYAYDERDISSIYLGDSITSIFDLPINTKKICYVKINDRLIESEEYEFISDQNLKQIKFINFIPEDGSIIEVILTLIDTATCTYEGDNKTVSFQLPENTRTIKNVKINDEPTTVNYKFNSKSKIIKFDIAPKLNDRIEININLTNLIEYEQDSINKVYKDVVDSNAYYNRYILVRSKTGATDKYAYSNWKILDTGTLIIVDDETEAMLDSTTIKDVGKIYHLTVNDKNNICTWNELKFKYNIASDNPSIDLPSSASNYDVCCILEKVNDAEKLEFYLKKWQKKNPYLWANKSEVKLNYKKAIQILPKVANERDLYFRIADYTNYVYTSQLIEDKLIITSNDLVYDTLTKEKLGYDLTTRCSSVKKVLINDTTIDPINYNFDINSCLLKFSADTWPELEDTLIVTISTHWIKCYEGYNLSELYMLPSNYLLKENSIIWKRGGAYYIYYNNTWNLYTYPLYFTKLVLIGVK